MALKKTTLEKQGSNLPIGIVDGGELIKPFTLRPHKFWIDRFLANWRSEQVKAEGVVNPAREMTAYVALRLESVGEKRFPNPRDDGAINPETELWILQNLFMADMLYLYAYARVTVSKKIQASFPCEACKKAHGAILDMGTLDVLYAETADDVIRIANLTDGIPVKVPGEKTGGRAKLYREIVMGPVPWLSMVEMAVADTPLGSVDANAILASIRELRHQSGPITPEVMPPDVLDDVSRLDTVKLDRATQGLNTCLDADLRFECPEKGIALVSDLDWTYESFFGSSIPVET